MRKVFAAVLMVFGVSCMGHAADIIISSSTGINFTLTGSSLAVSVTPDIAAAPAAITALHLATNTITGLIPTAHQQLSSTGTLTHAALESTLTAVTAATTTLKSVSDAQAATLVQVGVDTATLKTQITAIGTSTGTIAGQIAAIGTSTGTIATQITSIGTSTGTLRTNITSIGTSTATLRTDITDLKSSTGTIKTQITNIGTSTATLRTDLSALAVSTGVFTAVATATATLRTDLTAVKQSTGVTITSNWITLGATQTYVTTLSTRIASGIQTQPFTISSATARVNGGTSATLRLFITDKNTEFNISAATPIWNTGVVAGTAHTGGTMSNVSVLANQSITAVIDGISGAVVDIILWVRGYR